MAAGDVIVISEDASGRKGNYFDGVDDYVLHDAHAVARVAANDQVGTYTAWIYADDITTEQAILSAGDNNLGDEFLHFSIKNSLLQVKLRHSSTTQFLIFQSAITLESKKWYHVALVQDGTQPKLYINGIQMDATNGTATDLTFWYDELTLTDKFAIGVLESNNTHTLDFKGAIGQVKYFNIDLSADEILVEKQGGTHTASSTSAARAAEIEAARVFDITMEEDGTTDSGSGADDGTLTGNAHYGGVISNYSQALENNVTGHAAEFMNTVLDGSKTRTIIKRGD